jgi:hypothetical protein
MHVQVNIFVPLLNDSKLTSCQTLQTLPQHQHHAIKHPTKCCADLKCWPKRSLKTAELASSLHLRQLPHHVLFKSNQTALRTRDHHTRFLGHPFSEARPSHATHRKRNRPPTNLLRPLPKHLPLRPTAQSPFHTRPQATAQRVHPAPRPSTSRSRRRRQAATSRGSERAY